MPTQSYGLTGRYNRPNYVGVINAKVPYLATKKRLKDEEEYRNKVLALQEKELAQSEKTARESLEAQKKASTMSSAIGLGNLGLSAYYGRKKDKAISDIMAGGSSTKGSVTPSVGKTDYSNEFGIDVTPSDVSKTTGIISGLKEGAKKFGPIATGAFTGASVGKELTSRFIDDTKLAKGLGGAATAGALTYLASSDPYSSAISAVLGGLGSIF